MRYLAAIGLGPAWVGRFGYNEQERACLMRAARILAELSSGPFCLLVPMCDKAMFALPHLSLLGSSPLFVQDLARSAGFCVEQDPVTLIIGKPRDLRDAWRFATESDPPDELGERIDQLFVRNCTLETTSILELLIQDDGP